MKPPRYNENMLLEGKEVIKDKYICPECGKMCIGYRNGWDLRLYCPSCGFDVATTYFDELDFDDNIYTLNIVGNEASIENIQALSSIFALHYLEARDYLLNNSYKMSGSAREIKTIKIILDDTNLKYIITPKFEY